MIANYHTHNKLCRHAGGTVEEYAAEAALKGLEEIGMSDHMPYPGDIFGMRMLCSELDGYIEAVKNLQTEYKDTMMVRLGLECEWNPKLSSHYDELKNKGIEYFILGQHFFERNGESVNVYSGIKTTEDFIDYAHSVNEGMATGLFTYLCHPDFIFLNDFEIDDNSRKAMDIIIDGAIKNGYPLELNANGMRRGLKQFKDGIRYPYPAYFFWEEVAKAGALVIIGSDCHSVDALYDEAIDKAEQFAKDYKLNLIEKLVAFKN